MDYYFCIFLLVIFATFDNISGSETAGDDDSNASREVTSEIPNSLIHKYLRTIVLEQLKEHGLDDDYNIYKNKDFITKPSWMDEDDDSNGFEENDNSWSIIWYIASFSGLILFFLLVSCSEWCCRKHVRMANATTPPPTEASEQVVIQETAPPEYELFAPPSYESLTNKNCEKSEYDVYVVPVHAMGTMLNSVNPDEPPSYSAVNLSYVPENNANDNSLPSGK